MTPAPAGAPGNKTPRVCACTQESQSTLLQLADKYGGEQLPYANSDYAARVAAQAAQRDADAAEEELREQRAGRPGGEG